MEMFQPADDDVYSLALCLVAWLYGDPSDQPDHDLARRRAQRLPGRRDGAGPLPVAGAGRAASPRPRRSPL